VCTPQTLEAEMRTLIVALLLVTALPACNRAAQVAQPTETATPAATEPAPEPTAAVTDSATPTTEPTPLEVWFARDVPRGVFVEPETHRPAAATAAVARAALELLVSSQPDDEGLTNLVPEGTAVLGVDLDGTTLTVDLDLPDQIGLGAAFEAAMYQQIVHTGAQFATVEKVRVLDEGEPPQSGHLDLSEPMEPDEFVVSPIVITEPAEGEQVSPGEVTVSGTANVFEANVVLRLLDPDGEVAEETFTTATCGTGCRGDWEHTFTIQEPGRWTIAAVEPDMSDGEGAGPFVTRRHVTVR
jgi:hypothetical protein